jgi:hypothetical protein
MKALLLASVAFTFGAWCEGNPTVGRTFHLPIVDPVLTDVTQGANVLRTQFVFFMDGDHCKDILNLDAPTETGLTKCWLRFLPTT